MTSITRKKRGRKPLSESGSVSVSIRLRDQAQREKLRRIGGSKTARELIDAAPDKA
jgi:hypothetical protein